MPDSAKVLGIHSGHDAGATLIDNGHIKFAVNEERFSRVKINSLYENGKIIPLGLPKNSLSYINDFDFVAVPFLHARSMKKRILKLRTKELLAGNIIAPGIRTFFKRDEYIYSKHELDTINFIKNNLKKDVYFVDHHLAHSSSAYFTSGFNECLVITVDGAGNYLSGSVWLAKSGNLQRIIEIPLWDSLGFYYGKFTELLGFKRDVHEGKVLGLAARGNSEKNYHKIKDLIGVSGLKYKSALGRRFLMKGKFASVPAVEYLNNVIGNEKIEDVAAACQRRLEEVVLEWIGNVFEHVKQNYSFNGNLALTGGVFANVRLNQKIMQLPQVRNIYIHPNMGDGGLATGAALYVYGKKFGLNPFKLENIYFGIGYSDEEIKAELKKNNLKFNHTDEIEGHIADLLSNGKVVARFDGRMEYGPRALGNRSILYQATDVTVQDWLNKLLDRTEFMPFAPVTLDKFKHKCYETYDSANYTSKFMTITLNCKDYMKENQPAVVHLDGTARPQILSPNDNPSYFKILNEYYKITGIPSLINTSFNMHEEPIVCSPADAISSFKRGNLDYLAISNYLVKQKRR